MNPHAPCTYLYPWFAIQGLPAVWHLSRRAWVCVRNREISDVVGWLLTFSVLPGLNLTLAARLSRATLVRSGEKNRNWIKARDMMLVKWRGMLFSSAVKNCLWCYCLAKAKNGRLYVTECFVRELTIKSSYGHIWLYNLHNVYTLRWRKFLSGR